LFSFFSFLVFIINISFIFLFMHDNFCAPSFVCLISQNDLEGLLQAVMREREFLKGAESGGQTMDILVAADACRAVFTDVDTRTVPETASVGIRNEGPQVSRDVQVIRMAEPMLGLGKLGQVVEERDREELPVLTLEEKDGEKLPVLTLKYQIIQQMIHNTVRTISRQHQLAVFLLTEELPRRFLTVIIILSLLFVILFCSYVEERIREGVVNGDWEVPCGC
jgi:hypothetical protein